MELQAGSFSLHGEAQHQESMAERSHLLRLLHSVLAIGQESAAGVEQDGLVGKGLTCSATSVGTSPMCQQACRQPEVLVSLRHLVQWAHYCMQPLSVGC